MKKIKLIIDALSVAQNSVWSALNQEALAYAIELKLELAKPDLSIEANRVAYDVAMHYANKTKAKLAVPEQEIDHPNPAAKHWHDLYKTKCQEFHDKQTMLGTEIVALEEELAELKEEQLAKPKPVALKMVYGEVCCQSKHDDQSFGMWCPITEEEFPNGTPFYTASSCKPWVGLTDDEIHKIINDCTPDQAEQEELNDFARAVRFVEAKLREKNLHDREPGIQTDR